jgi:hypothetical protein
VRVLRLPGLDQAGDVVDWIERGGTREALETLSADAPTWAPNERIAGSSEAFARDGTQRGGQEPARPLRREQRPAFPPLRRSATPLALPNSADIRPRQFLHSGHYIRGHSTGTISPGGFGKTALTLAEMIAMALTGLVSGTFQAKTISKKCGAALLLIATITVSTGRFWPESFSSTIAKPSRL